MIRVLIAALALVLVDVPAHADEAPPTPRPAVVYPLVNADGSVAHVVRLEAGTGTWRIRMVARRWDALIDGLSIEVGPCRPDVPCAKVTAGDFGYEWSGLTTFDPTTVRSVMLNNAGTIGADRRRIAAHELGHALGLGHHYAPRGLMCVGVECRIGKWGMYEPSRAEVEALAAYFTGVPS